MFVISRCSFKTTGCLKVVAVVKNGSLYDFRLTPYIEHLKKKKKKFPRNNYDYIRHLNNYYLNNKNYGLNSFLMS